jgi:hypothetical protein
MSVLEASDDAVRCLRKRQTEVSAQLEQLALITAEIGGMTDVLELQEALRRLVRFSDEVLHTTQKVLEASVASALVNCETAETVAALQRLIAYDPAARPGHVLN